MNVDTLNPAAGLAAIEKRTVDEILHGVRDVRIVPHVRGIASTQLEPRTDEALSNGMLNGMTASHRAGKRNESHTRVFHNAFGVLVREMQHLKDAVR